VPQKLHIDPTLPMTVARFLNLPHRRDPDEAAHALSAAGVPGLADRQMSDLSGGQFQRVLLARALLARPELLILDEATQGLDQAGSAAFYRQIEHVRAEMHCAVLMVSHELHVVMSASDRVICLNGHVCCEGTPEIVASAPEYRALFGTGTQGALALYRHTHDHRHDGGGHDHAHDHPHHHHETAPR
jgi:zinc transport system ATP-binding protein